MPPHCNRWLRLGAGLLITPSRRTPEAVTDFVREATEGAPRILWDGTGENPYPQFLAHADAFIAPADSVNMTGEPCATGRPVYVFEPEGGSAKFTRFHDALRAPRGDAADAASVSSGSRLGSMRRSIRPRASPGDRAALGQAAPDAGRGACRQHRAARPDRHGVPHRPAGGCHRAFHGEHGHTILATALPTIARDLGLDPISLKLAVTSYLVSLAVFIPVSGWVADRVGARTTFRLALDGVHGRLHRLRLLEFARRVRVLARGAGVGGAMMVPVGRMVVIRAVPKDELVRALSFIAMPALIGPMLGPPLGGLIVTYADWRWIFFVNIPIGILGIILASLFIPDIKQETAPLDVGGLRARGPRARRPDPGRGHDGPAHRARLRWRSAAC